MNLNRRVYHVLGIVIVMGALCTLAIGETNAVADNQSAVLPTLFIKEFRVKGAHILSKVEIEKTVYPYLGPGRTREDVEKARLALEDAYHTKGYQTVSVQIPQQEGKHGIVYIQVVEAKIEKLRVNGAQYFSPNVIKANAPSLAEGTVPNFNQVTKDIISLNKLPDRQVTPSLSVGSSPGSVDVDLNVKDSNPIHGSIELNNRYSSNTRPLRINGSISDSNIAQSTNALGVSFQISPQSTADAKVFSGYYLVRATGIKGLTLIFQGTKQDSSVSTLGGVNVAGRGESAGLRAIMELPGSRTFYQSLSFGTDYKHFDQNVSIGTNLLTAPVSYVPLSALYSGTIIEKFGTTDVNFGVNFGIRGAGSNTTQFDARRYLASGDFIYVKADVSQTLNLTWGLQGFAKLQGQISAQPLLDSEQISGGGLSTVRGYLESEVVGDNGGFATVELRSTSLSHFVSPKMNDWRIYLFSDVGAVVATEALPQQAWRFALASYGIGTHLRFDEHFNGSLDAAVPLISRSPTKANDTRITFRLWSDF
ncbi:MAG: ShlB/FhaC/HecB family hemolysin secretion/activation protein [Verrucomicrobiota bacterium]